MRRLAALGVLLLGALLGAVVLAGPASAHAELVAATPADGSRLGAAPGEVVLRFSESVSIGPGYVHVVDPGGARVESGAGTADGSTVRVRLRTGLGAGSYVVSWRIVSTDSHPVTGAVAFVVGTGPLAGSSAPAGGSDVVSAAYGVVRWLGFGGLALLVGVYAAGALWWPGAGGDPRARRLARAGWAALLVATLAGLLLQGPYAAGRGLTAALDAGLLADTVISSYGVVLLLRLALLVAVVLSWPARRTAGLVLAAVVVTVAGTGHAVAGAWPGLAVASEAVHLAAMGAWLGGLVVLAACLLRRTADPEVLAEAVPRFSRLALGCVLTLTVTGIYQSLREVGAVRALWETDYGELLVVKLVVFGGLVLLGAGARSLVARRYVVPAVHALAVATSEPEVAADSRRRLRRSVGLEVVLGAVVLAVTAVLVATPTAREAYSAPYSGLLALPAGGTVEISIDPARTGRNTVHLYVFGADGRIEDPQEVTAVADNPARQIGPLPLPLTHPGPGHYVDADLELPVGGSWRITVAVRTSDFDQSSAVATVTVP